MTGTRKKWRGAAAIIVMGNKILMVKEKESERWSIPSGGIEEGEFPEQACIREVWEETGFKVKIEKILHIKKACVKNYDATTHYFLCKIKEGQITYQDPDDSIEEIAWKTADELSMLQYDYPEDQETLLSFFTVETSMGQTD